MDVYMLLEDMCASIQIQTKLIKSFIYFFFFFIQVYLEYINTSSVLNFN